MPRIVLVALLAASACAHPYSGRPDKLPKPRPKKPAEASAAVEWDDECRANLHDDKPPRRRSEDAATRLARDSDQALVDAEDQRGTERIATVVNAMKTLRNALDKDQFNTEATYKMAVAYALVGKRKCSLLLLERLNHLQRMVDVARKAELTVQRALKDPSFDGFRKDADTALGN